jgi:protein-disulfide isomerase
MSDRASARWQSLAETLALLTVAAAVVWIAMGRPVDTSVRAARGPAPARPSAPRNELPLEPIPLEGAATAGSPNASIGMVIYSDFQCPFCGKFARETMPTIEAEYVRPGKVLVAFRHFPLPNHQFAQTAAEAAACAGRQGRFWPFHDRLFAGQQALDRMTIRERAKDSGVDSMAFAACLESGATSEEVRLDKDRGEPLGIVGTPTFLVGPLVNGREVKVQERFSGALPVADFRRVLDRVLSSAKAG